MLSPMLFYAFTIKMFIKLLNIPPRYDQHLLKTPTKKNIYSLS